MSIQNGRSEGSGWGSGGSALQAERRGSRQRTHGEARRRPDHTIKVSATALTTNTEHNLNLPLLVFSHNLTSLVIGEIYLISPTSPPPTAATPTTPLRELALFPSSTSLRVKLRQFVARGVHDEMLC